jgi:hypothetical protein
VYLENIQQQKQHLLFALDNYHPIKSEYKILKKGQYLIHINLLLEMELLFLNTILFDLN